MSTYSSLFKGPDATTDGILEYLPIHPGRVRPHLFQFGRDLSGQPIFSRSLSFPTPLGPNVGKCTIHERRVKRGPFGGALKSASPLLLIDSVC